MHLDTMYIYVHNKIYTFKFAKITYNLERREYVCSRLWHSAASVGRASSGTQLAHGGRGRRSDEDQQRLAGVWHGRSEQERLWR
jgi:hypothetical protein